MKQCTHTFMKLPKHNLSIYSIGFFVCLIVRLLPFRAPNIEPILAMEMPFAKAYGKTASFLFAFSSMVIFDALTGKIGVWTIITAFAYGALGIWAYAYLKNKKSSVRNYAAFAVMGTLAYDAVTGLSIGPLFFHQPFMAALIGQIPFTALHLLGNVSFAILLSPMIYTLAAKNKNASRSAVSIITNKKYKTL